MDYSYLKFSISYSCGSMSNYTHFIFLNILIDGQAHWEHTVVDCAFAYSSEV